MKYKLWQLTIPNERIISRIRVDRGTFTDYNEAVERAEVLSTRLSEWEIELLGDDDDSVREGGGA